MSYVFVYIIVVVSYLQPT